MKRQKRNRALSLAVLALGFCGVAPGWAAVTPGGDTTVAATTLQGTFVGITGIGALNVDGGSSLTNGSGHLGYNASSAGTATVSGAGSTWFNSSYLYVGRSGNGTLSIEAGGQVRSITGVLGSYAGSHGTATVTGAGSAWTNFGPLSVGLAGAGTLSVEAGGQVNNSDGHVGRFSGSNGTASVSGAGSKWANSGSLFIGYDGSGRLTVNDGGVVTAKTIYASLADLHGDGTISVSGGAVLDADLVFDSMRGTTQALAFGSGGTLDVAFNATGSLGAGYKGSGTLRIAEGMTVASASGYLGQQPGSSGAATVSGTGTRWTSSGELQVGAYGRGMMRIEAGAQVSSYAGSLGYQYGSTGTATVHGTGSGWMNKTNLYVGREGNGTLNIESEGQVSSSIGQLGHYTGSSGTVTVSGSGSSWTNSDRLYIGGYGNGTLRIDAGGQVSSGPGYLGQNNGSNGAATVSGTGSRWTSSGTLYIGGYGNGVLSIEAGGQVSSGAGFLGDHLGATGTVTVSGPGSVWTSSAAIFVGNSGRGTVTVDKGGAIIAQGLFASPTDLFGNGTITTKGAVLDSHLVFDQTRGATQTLTFGSGGTLNLTIDGTSDLGAGYKGSGNLQIADGMTVASNCGYLGYNSGSTGTAIVSGAGSAWVNSYLAVGLLGRGTLTVTDGGNVTTAMLSVNSSSAVRVQVTGDDMLVLGNATGGGNLINNGTVTLCANTSLRAGIYRPISAYPGQVMGLSGDGGYRAIGGAWDPTARTFTVAELTELAAGDADRVASGERLLVTDSAIGRRVGISFGTITAIIDFSAAPMDAADVASLAGMLEKGREVRSAWSFVTDYTGGEALLSFDIGGNAEELEIWRYSNGVWSAYTPGLLTHDANGIASFTVSSFSGYAVTAAVPEPGMMGLLALAGSALLIRRRPRG